MKVSRFSITLYVSLPVLISVSSIVMIAQFVFFTQGQYVEDGRYADALKMIEYVVYCGERAYLLSDSSPLLPSLYTTLYSVAGLADTSSFILVAGSINFLFILAGFGIIYLLSLRERRFHALEIALIPVLIFLLPAFWQGIFLPVGDAFLFFLCALVLYSLLEKKLLLYILACGTGLWISAWFLPVLLLPLLISYLRTSRWPAIYVAMLLLFVGHILASHLISLNSTNALYYPGTWLPGSFEFSLLSLPILFLASFIPVLFYIIYRWITFDQMQPVLAVSVWFTLLFIFTSLIVGEPANRIIFIFMPLLPLLAYQKGTFEPGLSSLHQETENTLPDNYERIPPSVTRP
ncbi:hypothetical protein QLX67_07045 [Balneolaceae bacterium ANBcel3]|nr:hypothetical protein [Balneolaceae bacterium ANBcel3]